MKPDSDLLNAFKNSTGVSIDTRTLQPGNIFFALKGSHSDGHEYVKTALEKGASCAVVSDRSFDAGETVLVDDTLAALQDLASAYRAGYTGPLLAITGSNGKTTTKELVARVLQRKFNVHVTSGNYNNHIGVPLTLLAMPAETNFAIIEMGANHVGEIAFLCRIAAPNMGLITNIGKAHLEGFGGIEGVKKGKSELYRYLAAAGGLGFVNRDEKFLPELSDGVVNRVFYGQGLSPDLAESGNIDIQVRQEGESISYAFSDHDGRIWEGVTGLYGRYNIPNIITAVAIGLYFQVPSQGILEAIEDYVPDNNRSQRLKIEGVEVIMDAYNANPTSMLEAIAHFKDVPGKKVLILGAMKELGLESANEHRQILEYVSKFPWHRVFLVGGEFEAVAQASGFEYFEDADRLARHLVDADITGCKILLKGSRSLTLERVLPGLKR